MPPRSPRTPRRPPAAARKPSAAAPVDPPDNPFAVHDEAATAHITVVEPAPAGRPWSLSAAMEPIPPLEPPRPVAPSRERARPGAWVLSAVVALAVLAAGFVLVASRLHLGTTPSPAFGINGLSTVRSQTVPDSLPDGHVPPGTTSVEVAADYVGADPGITVQFTVTPRRRAIGTGTGPASPIVTVSHTFTAADGSNGQITATITATGGPFPSGVYAVEVVRGGVSLRSATLTVDPAPSDQPPPPR